MTWCKDRGWKYRQTAKAKRSGQNVQPACGQTDVSVYQYFCSSLAPPAVQRGDILSILGAAGSLDRGAGTHKHTKNRNTSRHSSHCVLSFFLGSHSLFHTQTLTYTQGTFYRSRVRQKLRYWLACRMGLRYSGTLEMMDTNKMADH